MEQRCGEIFKGQEKGDMVMERIIRSMEEKYLVPGDLEGIRGQVAYFDYNCLS